jgi:hypothetical protein
MFLSMAGLLSACTTIPPVPPDMPQPSRTQAVADLETALAEPAPEGTAVLHVFDDIATGRTMTRFSLNGKELGVSDAGVFRVVLLPGTHRLGYEIPGMIPRQARALELEEGEVAWVQVQFDLYKREPYVVTVHEDPRRALRSAIATKHLYLASNPPLAYAPPPVQEAAEQCFEGENLDACMTLAGLPDAALGDDFQARRARAESDLRQRLRAEEVVRQREALLPATVRRDKYMVSLTALLSEERFDEALPVFEQLAELDVGLDPAFDYFYGEALLRTGDAAGALERLYRYVGEQGNSADYYRNALVLINEAEQAL